MRRVPSIVRVLAFAACVGPMLAGCSPIGLGLTAAGMATDTSVTWEIVKHVHAKLTEDDPTPCILLNSVQRALNARCTYQPGSIHAADFASSGLQECPLAAATRDPRLWRALPELIEKGPGVETCNGSPLLALAESHPCPDFASASPAVRQSLVTLAETDPRAIRHDVFRMFSCSNARAVGLDHILVTWLDRGELEPGKLSFSPLSALDPEMLVGRFGHELEVAGHTPEAALDGYEGTLPSGYETALRRSDWAALEWWLYRLPQLANFAPPQRGGQLGWVPLQRVLLTGWLEFPGAQADTVRFLLAHGADPQRKLPFDPGRDVVAFAAQMKSPMLPLLEPRPVPVAPASALARADTGSLPPPAQRDASATAPPLRAARAGVEATLDARTATR